MDDGDVGPGCQLSLRLMPRRECLQVSGTTSNTIRGMSLLYHSLTCTVLCQAQRKLDSSNLNLASVNLAELDLAYLPDIIRWTVIG